MRFLKLTLSHLLKKVKITYFPPFSLSSKLNYYMYNTGPNFYTKLNHVKLLCQYKELHNSYHICLEFRHEKNSKQQLKRNGSEKGRLQRREREDQQMKYSDNSNLPFKYENTPKETTDRIYCSGSHQNSMQTSSAVCWKCKVSGAVHDSFWTLQQGLI